MGLFSKKKKPEQESEVPKLPELPSSDNDLILPSKSDLPDVPAGLPEIETTESPALPELP